MIAIEFEFLSGRYHATPWGRHVNEGAVEWPPSPWRVLRALVATWKRTLPELRQADVEPLLRALAEPPEFILPIASTGHTRHFMPWFKKGPEDRTLIFDTFVVLPRHARLVATWREAKLDRAEELTLARILFNLNTLGRSESWCSASMLGHPPEDGGARRLRCRPLGDETIPAGHDLVRLLCPDPATAFAAIQFAEPGSRSGGRRKRRLAPDDATTLCDPSWNLCADTLQLHKEKWSDPPGSRWVPYARPPECFRVEPRGPARAARQRSRFQVARYALDSTVLPLVTETLTVAEAARRALIFLYTNARGRAEYGGGWSRERHRAGEQPVSPSPLLTGKDGHLRALEGHRHAYYLPTDEDGDGRVDHLTVCAADGFDSHEIRALDRLRELRTGREGEERHALRLLLIGLGRLEEYPAGPLRPAREWVSATPYLATRYAKTRGRERVDIRSLAARAGFLTNDLRAELARHRVDLSRDDLAAIAIDPLWDENLVFRIDDRWRPLQFRRFRQRKHDDGGRRLAGAFRLTFRNPIAGPLALGHSSHFGMGLFRRLGPGPTESPRC